MNKQEFFDYLNKRLEILNKKEREDILAEFDQHITNKIENGASEAEAIADFGDPEEFVEEILDAYKVNPEYNQIKEEAAAKNSIGRFLKNFGSAVNAIADSLFQKSKRELLGILVKLIVLCLILWAINMPLTILLNSVLNLFNVLPDALYSAIDMVIRFIYNLAYLMLVCYSVYLFVAKYFLADWKRQDTADNSINQKEKTRKEKVAVYKENDDSVLNDSVSNEEKTTQTTENAQSNGGFLTVIKDKGRKFREENSETPTAHAENGDKLLTLLTVCLKILIIFCLLPFGVYAVANLIGFAVALVMIFMGLPTVGITIAALGSLLCVCVFIVFVFRAVFPKSNYKK